MNKIRERLEQEASGKIIKTNEPMRLHTTFKTGGPAEYYVEVDKLDEMIALISVARSLKMPTFIFGGGSHIIVSEKGITGLVIKNNCRSFELQGMTGTVKNRQIGIHKALVYAESGVLMNQLVRFSIERGLCGLEYQLGLPGTVGGAVYLNASYPIKQAFVGDSVQRAQILTKDGEIKEVSASYFQFGYNWSSLHDTGDIVLSTVFSLTPLDAKELWDRGTEALSYRNDTVQEGGSVGCTFRDIATVADTFLTSTADRVSKANYFLDKIGIKGKRIGNVMLSLKYPNFIINLGDAKVPDIISLVDIVKQETQKKSKIQLHFEVTPIGVS